MKRTVFAFTVLLSLIAGGFALANRPLDRTEVLQIFQTLTDEARRTWIPSGIVEGRHLAYKASNGYITKSTVIVKYDGERFYWEVNVDSHTKQTKPRESPDRNSSRDDLDLDWNKRRVFAWDGDLYTMYFRPGNHAIVTESPSDIPVVVNGPLTAGIVPWGYGVYTLESLLAAKSSAFEVQVNGQKQVHLRILMDTERPTLEMVFVLDPAKDCAVLSYSQNDGGMASILKTYGDYELVSGKWIPTTIIIERYDENKQSAALLSYDYWDLTSVRVSLPQSDSFNVAYENNALVEFYSPITDKPLSYRYSNEFDLASLLQDRLAIVSDNMQTQNCATAAIKYIAGQLGKNITARKLAELVNEPHKDTSLYELREFARQSGFHCLTIKTDVQTLKSLKGCKAILHLPGPNHYVVLDRIDDEYVWVIDLDGNKFYFSTKIDEFSPDWGGTALVVSNEPLDLKGSFREFNNSELYEIIGAFPNYSCTEQIQKYDVVFCSEPTGGLCGGRYRKFYNRWGCEPNPEGGSCTGTGMVGNQSSPCINNPEYPWDCTITGEWFSQHIRACK